MHAAAHHRPATDVAPIDVAPNDVAPTAVRDRRGPHLLRGYFFLAGGVTHATAPHRPATDVAPTDVAPTDVAPTAVRDLSRAPSSSRLLFSGRPRDARRRAPPPSDRRGAHRRGAHRRGAHRCARPVEGPNFFAATFFWPAA